MVELATYQDIQNTHWTEWAVPAACVLSVGVICLVTLAMQLRHLLSGADGTVFHPPEPIDYVFVIFDPLAAVIWIVWSAPTLANAIAVWTTLFTFVPMWRTTFREPESEIAGPWILWCMTYSLMVAIVALEQGSFWVDQMIYPASFLVFHLMQAGLCLRQPEARVA